MNRHIIVLLGLGLMAVAVAGVDTAWVRRYDGPAHGDDRATEVAVDSAGNVYVAGRSEGGAGYDFVTIKYRPNGDTAWVRRRDLGGNEIPSGLGVDAQGNVYVTGNTNNSRGVTLKYDSTGHLEWTRMYGTQVLLDGQAIDADGSVVVCGGEVRTTTDCVVIKYRPNGDTAWLRFFDWAGYGDDLDALVLTSRADINAVGFCSDTSPGGNILTLACDSAGNWLWASRYDGPHHGADWPVAIAVDHEGNSIVAGISDSGYGTPWDYITVKYDSTGETLWTRRYNGTADENDEASAVAVDADGRVYITGYSTRPGTATDYATVAYASSGELRWVVWYNGPGNLLDEAEAIAVAHAGGEVYVTGSSYGGPGRRSDCSTVMYDSTGRQLWVGEYNSGGSDAGSAIAVGLGGSFCVAGRAGGDLLVIKYLQGGAVEDCFTPDVVSLSVGVVPNPVVSRVTLRFVHPAIERATVRILDVSGRVVRAFAHGPLNAGTLVVDWDRTDDHGLRVPAGVYVIVLDAGGFSSRVKATLLE